LFEGINLLLVSANIVFTILLLFLFGDQCAWLFTIFESILYKKVEFMNNSHNKGKVYILANWPIRLELISVSVA